MVLSFSFVFPVCRLDERALFPAGHQDRGRLPFRVPARPESVAVNQ
jgi:hypothetical protein